MRYSGIIILLVLCLTLLLLTDCVANKVKPEPASGNLENQEDINQSSNNSQSLSTSPIYEPVIEEDTEDPGTVYPQKWATGDGTAENPWANDCIQKAYDAVSDGGTIYLKAGYYVLSAQVSISKQISVIGEGMGNTIIKTANATGFVVGTSYFTIKNLTIDGTVQTKNQKYLACINISTYSEYALFENIEVKNAGYYGINVYEVNHSLFQNIYAHDNYEMGVHPGSDKVGWNKYNTYRNIYTWNNGHLGFGDRGNVTTPEDTNNIYDNLQSWGNGTYGIEIAYQKDVILSNLFANGNGEYGISLYAVENSIMDNCEATYNGGVTKPGVCITRSDNINLTNVIAKNNHAGIRIQDCSNIALTSCQFYDDRDAPLQTYGIELTGANTNIRLVNCKLTPNKEGEVYDPAGVVLTVIKGRGSFPSAIVRE